MARAPKIEAVTLSPNPVPAGGQVIIRVKVSIPVWERLRAWTWGALKGFTWGQVGNNDKP